MCKTLTTYHGKTSFTQKEHAVQQSFTGIYPIGGSAFQKFSSKQSSQAFRLIQQTQNTTYYQP